MSSYPHLHGAGYAVRGECAVEIRCDVGPGLPSDARAAQDVTSAASAAASAPASMSRATLAAPGSMCPMLRSPR